MNCFEKVGRACLLKKNKSTLEILFFCGGGGSWVRTRFVFFTENFTLAQRQTSTWHDAFKNQYTKF